MEKTKNIEIEKKEVSGYGFVDGMTKSYTRETRLRREAAKQKKIDEAHKIILEYIAFYNVNYPKSTHDIEWISPKRKIDIGGEALLEQLDLMSEEELIQLHRILTYSRKEGFSGNMKDHYRHLHADAYIKKRIPSFELQEELERLENTQNEIDNKKKRLRKKINESRKELQEKQDKTIAILEDLKEAEEKPHKCEICGFRTKQKAGLASHIRAKHPEIINEPKETNEVVVNKEV